MKLIQSLEREGGHIIVLSALVFACVILSYLMPENELTTKVGDLSMGALLLAMKGVGNGSQNDSENRSVKSIKLASEIENHK